MIKKVLDNLKKAYKSNLIDVYQKRLARLFKKISLLNHTNMITDHFIKFT